MADQLLDADETAASLHITKATLYKLIKDGRVPARKIGGKWKFIQRDIEELFAGAGLVSHWGSEREPDE
jgi:excisionase family DNA binding protein